MWNNILKHIKVKDKHCFIWGKYNAQNLNLGAVIVWQLDLQLLVISVHITTNVSLNPAHGEVYSIQLNVIKLVNYLRYCKLVVFSKYWVRLCCYNIRLRYLKEFKTSDWKTNEPVQLTINTIYPFMMTALQAYLVWNKNKIKLNKYCSSNKLQDCSYNNKTLLFNWLKNFENEMNMK